MYFSKVQRTISDKGMLVPSDQVLVQLQRLIAEEPDKDYYISYFKYTEDALELFNKNHSIKGYNGKVYSDYLIFDFDDKNDLNSAKDEVRKLLLKLHELKINVNQSCSVFFSGGKGFHVYVKLNKDLEQEDVSNICKNIAKELNLKTFDTSIYNTQRIIRAPFTKHQKTGLYKIYIKPIELKNLTIEAILEKAKAPNQHEYNSELVASNTNIFDIYKTEKKELKSVIVESTVDSSVIRGLHHINFDNMPKGTPRCIYALQQGVMVPNELDPSFEGRSKIFFRLATYFRNQGFDKVVTHRTLKGIAELNHKLYPECEPISKDEIWAQHIASAYNVESIKYQKAGSPGATSENDILMHYCEAVGEHTNKHCCLHKKRLTKDIYNTDDMYSDFKAYASKLEKNTIKTGINFIDNNMTISRGEVTLLVGSNGSGKTTCTLNLVENAVNFGIPVVFFSFDMHRNQLFLKLASKCTQYSLEQIKYYCKTNDGDKGDFIKQQVANTYKNVFFLFNATMMIEEMRDKVIELNQQHNIEIGLVVVDYAGRISGPYSDSYANAKYNALKSKEVADNTNAAWFILSQISRQKGDGSIPLRTSRAAKDSGDWEEASSNVITIWRPFLGQGDKDNVLKMYLAKNRMGPSVEGIVHWNGAKSTILNMTDEEILWYEEERGEAEEESYRNRMRGPTAR